MKYKNKKKHLHFDGVHLELVERLSAGIRKNLPAGRQGFSSVYF
jgi:hypothetical protein